MIRPWFLLIAVLVVSCSAPQTQPSATATVVLPTVASTAATIPSPTAVSAAATTIPPTSTNVPPTPIPPTATRAAAIALPTTTSKPASNATGKLDIDKLLPAAPGRELVLQYCVNCHNIAPIALAHKTKEEWTYLFYVDHVNRAPISKADMDAIFNYFVANYPPDRKIPDLPPELLQDWTSY